MKFLTISCISSNLNRGEKQLLPVGEERGPDELSRQCERGTTANTTRRRRRRPTVQAHIVEGEDGRPAGGPCAMEGHMQDPVRRLNAVLLQRDAFGVKGKLSFQYSDLRGHSLECPLRSAVFTCMKGNSEGGS